MKNLYTSIVRFAATLVLCLIIVSPVAFYRTGRGTTITTTTTFTNFELSGAPGTVCPNTSGTCTNFASEPAIRADRDGNFFASSENGLSAGTDAWRSTDGGLHYATLVSPNSVSSGNIQLSPAGGDTDLAIAPRRNANGFFNVYVASLAVTNVYVSTSKDRGNTWFPNPTGASVTSDDREWVAADGASKICVSYRAPVPTTAIFVTCSYDAGLTFAQTASAFDADHSFLATTKTRIGNLAIDPNNHVIYQAFNGVASAGELLSAGGHVVYLAISIDGGRTFRDHVVYNNPNTSVRYGHQFVNVSVDSAGNIYLVFTDDHNLFYSFSKNFGTTWSSPRQINQAPSETAIFPWSVAGTSGALDVVWYGTSFFDSNLAPDTYPSSAGWFVFFAQNLQATADGSSFAQVVASPLVHTGGVCESGVTCTGNRDLFDDFGVAASPVTGLASIIYSDDQYTNTANEPPQPGCTPSQTNTINCDRTNIATQTSGLGVIQKNREFEEQDQDFEELDVTNPSNPEPDLRFSIANTGTQSITALAVSINGLSITTTWTPSLPLQPGQTSLTHTTLMPLGFLPTIGSVYQTTVTATLSDGTTASQTTSLIYTLGAGIGL